MAEGVTGANPKAAALRILPLLELAGPDEIHALCRRAKTPYGPVAAVCVASRFVSLAKEILAGSLVRVATTAENAEAVAAAVAAGADEVEIAFGDAAMVRQCRAACRRAGGANALLTVNIESGRIGDLSRIRTAALAAIDAGADLVATASDGVEPGATIAAAQAILEAVAASRARRIWAGIKVVGGIRTLSEAVAYLGLAERLLGSEFLSPATFRFGSAVLLDDLQAALQ
ncbi:MAG: deoC [Rhodospirillales bacterium]|nr:deoC [Rhodospirillales bacterium]